MTDSSQTVPVPVDLLKRIQEQYDGYPSATFGPLADLIALIPRAPKVGDTLTAAQVATLPYNAIVIDADKDPWVLDDNGAYMAYDGADTSGTPKAIYEPYTLVYLPDGD